MNFKRKYRILLVDDNVRYITALKMQLKDVLKDCIEYMDEASNGIEAIECLKKRPYHVVFMDIDMPVLNGIETARYIQNFFPQTHVIALSMHEEYYFIEQMLSAGSQSFITKDGFTKENVLKVFENFENQISREGDIS